MKSIIKRFLIVLLSAILVLTSFPANNVRAEETDGQEITEVSADQIGQQETSETEKIKDPSDDQNQLETTVTDVYHINPEYEDVIDKEHLISPEEIDIGEYDPEGTGSTVYTIKAAAVEYVKKQVMGLNSSLTFKYTEIADTSADRGKVVFEDIFNAAKAEAGDYYAHTYMGYGGKIYRSPTYLGSGSYSIQYEFIITVTYSVTQAQENELNASMEAVLDELDLYTANDYQKIKGVYDYVTTHVVYDDEAVSQTHDENDLTPWSAWKALIHGTAVCQGYSLLMYKMLSALGIEVYYANGKALPSNGNHAWNVVKLKGNYYLLDSTWDANYGPGNYHYFLKGTENFYKDHSPNSDDRYVLSVTDYDDSIPDDPVIRVEAVTIIPASAAVYIGESLQLTASVQPDNATNRKIVFNSDDQSVALVDAYGLVTGVGEGTATISVTSDDGSFTATSLITVEKEEEEEIIIPVTRIYSDVSDVTIDLATDDSYQLNITVEPEDATFKQLVYSSSDTDVLTVDEDGKVTALKPGSARVSVYPISNGYSSQDPVGKININFTVINSAYAKVTLHGNGGKIKVGDIEYDDYSFEALNGSGSSTAFTLVSPENKGFTGWFTDPGFLNAYEGATDTSISHFDIWNGLELYARFSDYVTITYDLNGGYYLDEGVRRDTFTKRILVDSGEAGDIDQTKIVHDDDISLIGWIDDDGAQVDDLMTFYPRKDVTLKAKWSDNVVITLIYDEYTYCDIVDGEYIRQKTLTVPKGQIFTGNATVRYVDSTRTFGGWYRDNAFTQRVEVYSIVPRNDMTLYFQSVPFNHVYLHANGGTFEDGETTKDMTYSGALRPRYTPVREGYGLLGWNTDPNATETENLYTVKFDADYTCHLYAVWQADPYEVRLHAGAGKFNDGSDVKVYQVPKGSAIYQVNQDYSDPQNDGGHLSGWYSDASLADAYFVTSNMYNYKPTASMDLYPRYIPVYSYTFDANGGYFYTPGSTTRVVSVYKGSDNLGYLSQPTHPTKAFEGWYDDPQGTGERVSFADHEVNGNKTYYAKWSDDTVRMTYHGNGGTRYGGADTYTVLYKRGSFVSGDNYYDNYFIRNGYLYDGLYYDAAMTQKVVKQYNFRITKDIDLYAGWTKDTYTVSFDLNGGNVRYESSYADVKVKRGSRLARFVEDPLGSNGQAFAGWTSDVDGFIGGKNELMNYVPSGNTVLTATYTSTCYRVDLHLGKAYIYDSMQGRYLNEYTQYVLPNASLEVSCIAPIGYSIEGFYYDEDYTEYAGNSIYAITFERDTDLYVRCVRQEQMPHLTVELEGGHLLVGGSKIYGSYTYGPYSKGTVVYASDMFQPQWDDDSKAFAGYSLSRGGSPVSSVTLNEDVTLYALYSDDTYEVTIDYNGGYSSNTPRKTSETLTVAKGKYVQLPYALHPDGLAFAGYYESPERTGTRYGQGETLYAQTDSVLYAAWDDEKYVVSFVVENGTITQEQTLYVGKNMPCHDLFMYRAISDSGLTFVGWYDDPTFSGKPYDTNTRITHDTILYAKFADAYSITFDANGGKFKDGSVSKTVELTPGQTLADIASEVPKSPSGKTTFTHWNTERDGSGTSYDLFYATEVSSDLLLYAQWNTTPTAVETVTIIDAPVSIYKGEEALLKASVSPESATYQDILWSVSDLQVASIDSTGRLTAKNAGKVTVTAQAAYGEASDSVEITVYGKLDVDEPFVRLYAGSTLSVAVSGRDDLLYSSDNVSVASIDADGLISGYRAGEFNIMITSSDGLESAQINGLVIDAQDPLALYGLDVYFADSGYQIDDADVLKGESLNLLALDQNGDTVAHEDLLYRTDNDCVSIRDGVLTGNSEGEAMVMVYDRHSMLSRIYYVYVQDGDEIDVRDTRELDAYYYRSNIMKVGDKASYDIGFTPLNVPEQEKDIQITGHDGLAVQKSFVTTYDEVTGRYVKAVRLEVEALTVGRHTVDFTYGRKQAEDSLLIEVLEDDEVVEVTFEAFDGKVIYPWNRQWWDGEAAKAQQRSSVTVHARKGSKIPIMDACHEEYGFLGWYSDLEDESTKVEGIYTDLDRNYIDHVDADLTLYAKYDDTYVSTFVGNGGKIIDLETNDRYDVFDARTPKGKNFGYKTVYPYPPVLPVKAIRNGYIFKGWYFDADCQNYFAGGRSVFHEDDFVAFEDAVPEEDATYYAGWEKAHVLRLDMGGGMLFDYLEGAYEITASQYDEIDLNEFVPEKPGKIFAGWYLDKALSRRVSDPGAFKINADTVLYAAYEDEYHTVSFDLGEGYSYAAADNYGSVITRKVAHGSVIGSFMAAVSHPDPDKKFNDRWYLDEACTQEIDVNKYVPEDDLTIYAGYSDMVMVTFDLDGGYFYNNGVRNTSYEYYTEALSKVYFPSLPRKEGYVFAGWYLDDPDALIDLGSFTPDSDTVLHAKWEAGTLTLTLDANGGAFEDGLSEIALMVNTGTTLAEVNKPERDEDTGRLIIGWAFDAAGEEIVKDDYAFTAEMRIYALYRPVVSVAGVSIYDAPMSIEFGQTYQLLWDVMPENADNKRVSWSLDDPELAVISEDGLFIPKKAGKVTVTVTTDDGHYSDSVTVTITDSSIRVRSLTPEKQTITLNINESTVNAITILPENATDKKLNYVSQNEYVATVDDNGVITGVGVGETVIEVASNDGNASCSFTVDVYDSYVGITSISLEPEKISVNKGETKTLSYLIVPENATNRNVTWSSSDPSIVTVDQNGMITGVSDGVAYVFVTAVDENGGLVGDFCVVTVTDMDIPVLEVLLNTENKQMVVGEEGKLEVTILPENATNKNVSWESSDEEVVTVDENGNIRALAEGEAYVSVTSEDGDLTDTCDITVTEKVIPVSGLLLEESEVKIFRLYSKQLHPIILPEDATERELIWSSADEQIATVDDSGNVTGVAVGSTTITVTTADGSGLSAYCTVVVEEASQNPRISFDKKQILIKVGGEGTITPTITPEEYADYGYEYDEEYLQRYSEYFELDPETGKIIGKKLTDGISAYIKARIKGLDTSGLEARLEETRKQLEQAKEKTETAAKAAEDTEKAKTAAEVDYGNAQNATASAQKDLELAEEALKIAQAEESAAIKDVENKEATLAEAEAKLAEAEAMSDDSALKEAEAALKAAEDEYNDAKAQIAKGTLGFFESNGSTIAVNLLENRVATQGSDGWGMTTIGGKGDATTLENMKESIRLIKVGNNLRDGDDNQTDLKPLKVSDAMMAMAEIQANNVKSKTAHSLMFRVAENLAWGYNDPYDGWYFEEKEVYDYVKQHGCTVAEAVKALGANVISVGHYTNLINPEYTYTGFGTISNCTIMINRKAYSQVFHWYSNDEKDYTIDEYERLFNRYYDNVYKRLADAKVAYDQAKDTYEQIKKDGGIDGAVLKLIEAAQQKVEEATEARNKAEEARKAAEAKVASAEEYVAGREAALEEAQNNEPAALEALEQAKQQYEIALGDYTKAKEEEALAQAAFDMANEDLEGIVAVCEVKVINLVENIRLVSADGQELDEIRVECGNSYYGYNAVVIEPADASIRTLGWSSSDESIVTVDEKGVITGVGIGEALVSVTTKDGSGITAQIKVVVIPAGAYGQILPQDRPNKPELIPDGLWIAGVKEEVEYDPLIKAYTQEFRVYDHKTLLVEGKDYTVSYANNKKAGTASITIKGKGNYAGTMVKTFEIISHDTADNDVIVILNKDTFVFNSKVQKPKVTSVEYRGVKLKAKTDYTVAYSNDTSKEVGEYDVIISFKGNYAVEDITRKYRIIENSTARLSLSNAAVSGIKSQAYTGGEIKQDVVVKYNKVPLAEGTDYRVSYRNNTNAGTGYVIIDGMGIYEGRIIKSFKITPIKLSAKNVRSEGLPQTVAYDGTAKEPDVSLIYGDTVLTEGQDYTVTYKNNIKAGKATITYKGIGNYSGSFKQTFTIGKVDIATAVVEMADRAAYVKGGAVAELHITVNGKELVSGTDYTLSYKNNTKPGLATVTIKGKGSYVGTLTKSFTVEKADLAGVMMTAPDKQVSTKSNFWKSVPVLTDTNGKKLKAGTDYEKTYEYALNGSPVTGTPVSGDVITVTVKGTGNYEGEASCTYRIVDTDLSKAKVKINAKAYTGSEIRLTKDDITVTLGKTVLDDSCYEIDENSYRNNTAKGSATVTIKGVGAYGGSKTVKFSIVSRNICQIIRFNANIEGASGSMKDQYIFKRSKLSSNRFKCKGHTFVGWSLDPNTSPDDAANIIPNKGMFDYSIFKAGKITELYAIWR